MQDGSQSEAPQKAPLLRRLTPCIPWPVFMPMSATSSPSNAFSHAAGIAKDLFEERRRKRMIDIGQKHIAKYGGRLLGGADSSRAEPTRWNEVAEEQLIRFSTCFEGILDGSTYLPTFYVFKDQFHIDPVTISFTFGIIMMPWLLKPALAMLCDRISILGRRRTPYITVSCLIIASGLYGAGTLVSYNSVVGSLCFLTIGRTLLGSAVQGILVEVGRDRTQDGTTKLVGDFFLLRSIAAVTASVASTWSVSRLGPRRSFRIFALLPALLLMGVIQFEALRSGAPEEPEEMDGPQLHSLSISDLRTMMSTPAVWGPLVFLFVYNAGPNYDDPLYFYFINQLQFEPYMVGELQIAHAVAKVIGIMLYRFFLLEVEDRKLIVVMTALSCPLMLAPLLLTTGAYKHLFINPRMLALSGELVRELFIQIQVMPAMSRWVHLTPKGYEGTMVSLLISTIHLSRASSKITSASMASMIGVTSTNFQNISVLITICGGSTLIPILFAHELIPDVGDASKEDTMGGSLHITDVTDMSTGTATGLDVSEMGCGAGVGLDGETRRTIRIRRGALEHGDAEEGATCMMPAG